MAPLAPRAVLVSVIHPVVAEPTASPRLEHNGETLKQMQPEVHACGPQVS